MRQIFLDTETTGLYPDQGDRVIEIGCVEMVHRKPTGNNLHLYLNPERDSHEDALRVHGITSAFLKDKPKFAAVVDDFLAYVQDSEVLIHNAAFDLAFLNAELRLLGRPGFKEHVLRVVDTLAMAKEMFPGKRNGLDALCDRLGVDNSSRTLHGALLDAELLADVYIHLTRGQDALLIDAVGVPEKTSQVPAIALQSFDLPVLFANDVEMQAHNDVLAQITKSSSAGAIWNKYSGNS